MTGQEQQSRYYARHDSGVSFSSSPACLFASTSSLPDPWSSSSESSSPGSASSTPSTPASSIASSPSLSAKAHLSPVLDDFSLDETAAKGPSPTQLTAYAASIIRNEAYALLALAARIAPADSAILDVDEERCSADDADALRRAIGSPGRESRTNIAFRGVVEALSNLPPHGKIVVTGVGKSGIAGRKMVATFCSLGIQSVFLHPLEALHGDLGVICSCSSPSPCDALLLISHSGATAELMRLLPIVRPRVRSLIAVTRDPDSVLARACTGWLDAGTGAYVGVTKDGREKVTDEADSALPAPTSSVVSALAVGDALALSLSKMRLGWEADGKTRRHDFLRCHPGGQLGIELGREGRGVEPSSASASS